MVYNIVRSNLIKYLGQRPKAEAMKKTSVGDVNTGGPFGGWVTLYSETLSANRISEPSVGQQLQLDTELDEDDAEPEFKIGTPISHYVLSLLSISRVGLQFSMIWSSWLNWCIVKGFPATGQFSAKDPARYAESSGSYWPLSFSSWPLSKSVQVTFSKISKIDTIGSSARLYLQYVL